MGKLSQGPEVSGELTIRTNSRESREKHTAFCQRHCSSCKPYSACFRNVSETQPGSFEIQLPFCDRQDDLYLQLYTRIYNYCLSLPIQFSFHYSVSMNDLSTSVFQSRVLGVILNPSVSITPNLYLILIFLLEKYLFSLNFLFIPNVSGRFSCHQTFSFDVGCQSQPLIGEVNVPGSEI